MSKTSPPKPAPGRPAPKRSPFADRRILLLLGVVAVAGAFYGFRWWSENSARGANREQLLAEMNAELQKDEPDLDALSAFMAQIELMPESATDPELLRPRAEVQLLRNRPEQADRLFGAVAASPGASAVDQRLGARILLAKQAGLPGDPAESEGMLRRVIGFSERAYADGGDAGDLLRAWQAATRLWDHERKKEFADRLAAQHADTPEGKLAALAASFDPGRDATAVADLMVDLDPPPFELRAMSTAARLNPDAQGQVDPDDFASALASAEADLLLAPGVPAVRYVAAVAMHICALGHAEGSPDRRSFVGRRDAQLEWLLARAPADEPQRAQWQAMRTVR